MFVDLPDQTAVLGRFACADCRRERHHAGSPQQPPVHVRLAQRVPTALAERRRARRSSFPPPPAPPSVPVAIGVGISPATSAVTPRAPRVEPADSRGAPAAAEVAALPAPTAGGSSTPAWVLPEEALAAPARSANSASRRRGLAAVGVALSAAALTALLAIRSTPQEPATAATPERATPVASGATAPAAVSPSTAVTQPVTEVDRGTKIQEELWRLAQQADRCRKPGDPAGVARLRLTFAPSGHAREISIERGAYSAPKDRVGSCLTALFRRARIEPFSGQPVTVTKSVVVR
jgi:hypothetical protein